MLSKRVVPALLATVVTFLALSTASASAFAPIEGVWEVTSPPNAMLLIQETSPEHFQDRNIRGEVGCAFDENGFVNPVGIFNGELIGSGLEYGGFRVALSSETCRPIGEDAAVTKIISTAPSSYRLRTCVGALGTGPPQYDAEFLPTSSTTHCSEALRVRPPEAPVTFGRITSLPPPGVCNGAAQRRGRVIKVKLKNPLNEPLLSALVKLGPRIVVDFQYPATFPALTKIRLPSGRSALRITLKTTSGKTFAKKRIYGPCRAKKKHHRRHHR
jgi:hypothetical protein